MRKSHFFPSKYLKADVDLVDGPLTLTIRGSREDMIGPERQLKCLLDFEETPKALVLNATNYDAISEIAGSDDTADWTGVRVTLIRGTASFGGNRVAAIRVRAPQAASAPRPQPRTAEPATDWSDLDEEVNA